MIDHVIYRQVSLTFIASESLKLSFILNFASKFAYYLTTISNSSLTRFAFDLRQKFEAVTERTRLYEIVYGLKSPKNPIARRIQIGYQGEVFSVGLRLLKARPCVILHRSNLLIMFLKPLSPSTKPKTNSSLF